MGPLAFPGCEVRESIRDSMMRSGALGPHDADDMGTCPRPCVPIIVLRGAGNPRFSPHLWAISPLRDMNDDVLSFHNEEYLRAQQTNLINSPQQDSAVRDAHMMSPKNRLDTSTVLQSDPCEGRDD